MADLADALDLGSSGSHPLEVRILSPAPFYLTEEIKKMLTCTDCGKETEGSIGGCGARWPICPECYEVIIRKWEQKQENHDDYDNPDK